MQALKNSAGWESWIAPLLIAVLSGIVATSPPAQPASRSPNTTAAKLVDERPTDDEPIHARSWEDPLLAVSDSAASVAPAGAVAVWRDSALRMTASSVDAVSHNRPAPERLTVILQEVVSGPGLEDEEARRQDRLATAMGLERAGFSPESTDLIRIRVERPIRSGLSRFMAAQWFTKSKHHCLLVFVPDGLLNESMGLPRLQSLAEQILAPLASRTTPEVCILRRSSGALIEDLAWAAVLPPSPIHARWDVINTGSTVSLAAICETAKNRVSPLGATQASLARASKGLQDLDTWFSRSRLREDPAGDGTELLQPLGAWRLGRVLNSDRNLVNLLKEELRLRRRSLTDPRHAMAVVCESDSPYGAEFAAEFKDQVASDQVRVLNFLSGLDIAPRSEPGRIAYQRHRDEAQNLQRAGISMQPTTPVGPRHVDYVYRQLEFYERDLVSQGRELSAVLICAYDQSDKRPLIQLVRERFPDALVMTTDLHASLMDVSDFDIMRNVVVASHLGLRASQPVQSSVPPFRSSYQTAAFLATLYCVGPYADPALGNLIGEMDFQAPRGWVYEIGQGAAVALPLDRPRAAKFNPYIPIAATARPRWQSYAGLSMALFGSSALCVVILSLLTRRNPLLKTGEVDSWQRAVRLGLQILGAAAAYALIVVAVREFGERLGEPWGVFDGVSAWPSELLRIAAVMLGVYFFMLCWRRIRHRLVEATVESFSPPVAPSNAGGTQPSLWKRLAKWTAPPEDLEDRPVSRWLRWRAEQQIVSASPRGPGKKDGLTGFLNAARHAILRASVMGWSCPTQSGKLEVEELLIGLRARTFARQIWIRLAILGSILLFVGLGTLLFMGVPMVPIRGEGAYAAHLVLMIVLGAVLNGLVLLVLDAGHTCNRFINLLSCERSQWPTPIRIPAHFATGIHESLIDSWLDVRAVGRTTAVVNSLIYFPIAIILLAAVAWHRSIDAWPHSVLLIVLYGMSLILCVVVGWSMRRSAERVRQLEIDRLKSRLSSLSLAPAAPVAVAVAVSNIEDKPSPKEHPLPDGFESTVVDGGVGQGVVAMAAPARVTAPALAAPLPQPAPVDRAQIQGLIDRIEAVKDGAFAPWREDPIVRGLVLPLVGVLSVKFAEWVNAAIHQA